VQSIRPIPVRIPSFAFAVVFALVASLILGGVLGYTLKAPVSVPGRTQVIVVHDMAVYPSADACVWVAQGHKGC